MLTQVAEGVLVHQSELLQNNTVVVQGAAGVLLADPGITDGEMSCLARDLRELGQPVVVGFSTHPDWDHVLWHPELGEAPRYATVRGATFMRELLAQPDWEAQAREGLPPEIADEISLEGLGRLTPLPPDTDRLPWDGPAAHVIEHPAHAQGHAALLIEGCRVLVAGDMLSDILMPFPDFDTPDPLGDYLTGLALLEGAADQVDVLIPGHGAVCGADQMRARIELDRAYIHALRDGRTPNDPRLRPEAPYGADWLPDVHAYQVQRLADRAT